MLQTHYVDVYQLHAWDPTTPLEETLRTLHEIVRSGRARYVGVSNFTGWQLQKFQDAAQHLGLERAVALQPQYNLLQRGIEAELVPVCENEGLGICTRYLSFHFFTIALMLEFSALVAAVWRLAVWPIPARASGPAARHARVLL
jgi:hypothetical protein